MSDAAAAGFASPRPLGQRFWVAAAVVAGPAMSILLVLDAPAIYLALLPAAAVGLAVLRQPRLGVYLIALSLPLDIAGNLISITVTFNISIAWICTMVTVVSWLVDMAVKRRRPLMPAEAKVLLAYLLVGLISLTTALEFDRGVEEAVKFSQTIVFFLMVLNILRTRAEIVFAISLLVAATVGSFGYALAQKFILPTNVFQERGIDLLRPGAVTYGIELGKVDTQGLESVERVTGTTLHSGVLALYCAYMLPFIMVFLRVRTAFVPQLLGWTAVLLTLGAFGTTLSRAGFLTLAFTLLMLVWTGIIGLTGARLLPILLLLVLGLPFLPEGFIDRVLAPSSYLASNSDSLNGRLEMWAASLEAILDHPITGLGLGNEHGVFDYWKPELRNQLGTVLNTWLQITMEVGPAGLIAFTLFVGMMFRRVLGGRRNFRAAGDGAMLMLGTGMLVLLMALMVSWLSTEFLRGGHKNVWFLLATMVAYHEVSRARLSARIGDTLDPGADDAAFPRPASSGLQPTQRTQP